LSSSVEILIKRTHLLYFCAAGFIFHIVVKANEAIQTVNLWAEKETKGLIRNFLSPGSIDSLTRLVLTNALYFKGAWEQSFDASKTKDYDFHLLNGTPVKVPFMTSMKRQFISAFDGFKVLCLPYKQGEDERQFSMYFFLPDAKDGLLGLIEKAASESNFLEDKLPHTKVVVGDFRIPRFNISFELEISDVLKELGVVLPFSVGGLTKIVDSPISVSTVLQKSVIEVNEESTKAAAVTASVLVGCCQHTSTPVPIDFVADHPFLFLIREDLSGTILFVGQVHNPLAG